ncbi:ComEA family DNA-binding protein [Ohtaekwangia koreensis]|uniref:Helix-hairpin-helix motif-containing protein n=1 Tax=Ohtaekwangia koreensis TaxID=688867 RepID=A0A1T5K2B7_9BACT|nr:helix-hairpin-helix domain-containing protein [Ohtaekwangia koreensis]SKC57781.1 Helix-hairpin-helix motif-containing protein [Ohtaekwangia koreensis]
MKYIIACIFAIGGLRLLAQDYPREEINLQKITDDLYSIQDLDLNYEDLYENLAQLLSHPLDLNTASDEELRFIKILSEEQIKSLTAHRSAYGNFLSVYELQAVPLFDLQTIQTLMPFVKVNDPSASINASLWQRMKDESDNYFIMRYERVLETKQGYRSETKTADRFKGSPDKISTRFRSSRPGDFSIGFSAEKDAGEQITWNTSNQQYGFDYISFHAQLQNKGRLKNLIVGDFQSQFGQGLMIGGVFGMGKGGETITTTRRSNIGHLPYTSFSEAGNLRGAAATLEVAKNLYWSGFYSAAKRDAQVNDGFEDVSSITSLPTTGLHRSETELARRKKTGERNFGGVLHYKKNGMDAGVMYNQIHYDHRVEKTPALYNQFAFRGDVNQNIGGYFNYSIQNISFFSEAAHSVRNGNAYVAGALWSLSSHLDLSLLYRKYDRSYHAFYSNAFAEGSTTQNERGTYWGWKYTFNRRFNITGYMDLFQFAWLRYRIYAPSTGHEWLVRINYQPSKKIILFAQIREEAKARNTAVDNATLYTISNGKKYNYWLHSDVSVSPNLRLKTRLQFSSYSIDHHTTQGMALMQDINFSIRKFEVTGRYALFDTDDYDNRQYVYENDVWLAFSLPAYYGAGIRRYVLVEYKLNRYISFWFRYAHTRYTDRESIGSGVDATAGNVRSDLKIQTRVKF